MWNIKSTAQFKTDKSVVSGDTVAKMFWTAASERKNGVIFRQKEYGLWQTMTWSDVASAVREIGLGLVELGFEPGETASILGNTRQEWMLSDLAVLCAGGVSSGIYPTDSAGQVEYLMSDSSSVVLFVEDEEQLDKVLEVRDRLSSLRKIIVWNMEGLRELEDPMVLSLSGLRDIGRARLMRFGKRAESDWQMRIDSRGPKDLAILIYTSGTTGRPKGAMLSHQNVICTLRGYNSVIGQDENDERMCFLPLCHVAERLGGAYFGLYTGSKLNFVENPETVPENVREIQPTVFVAVPRIWEKFYSAISIAMSESNKFEQWAYKWAIGVGSGLVDKYEAGRETTLSDRVKHFVARKFVFDNIKKFIGINRCRYIVTGAAPISPDLVRWYMALGVPVVEVWGQTEGGGASTIMPIERIKPGSIGVASPINEVKLSAENEILVRGPNVFMGYLNQPDKTAETVDTDGWLHSGDVGSVDADGFFRIHDRIKDIIITAGGKNITPSEIENQLKFSPYIMDAVVIGDKRPYLVCLVMIDHDNVEKFAQDNDVPFSNYTSLCRAPEVLKLIEGEIEKVNKQFARVEQLKKFRLIEQRLTAEDDELTPTMKLKRKFVNEKYAEMIQSMY